MKIAVIGTGYVGLVTGACFAEMGNTVVCRDIDPKKIEKLKEGILPLYEPGLGEIVRSNQKQGRLAFTLDMAEAVCDAEILFIAVGTPPKPNGSADIENILQAAREIAETMNGYCVIVGKSTAPVGTVEKIRKTVSSILTTRRAGFEFDTVSNPEFLKEGSAVNDFMRPDRIVVGAEAERPREIMKKLYEPFLRNGHALYFMDPASSEMTKYASNAMLACRISFINEIASLCERVGADIDYVRVGVGSDSRIGLPFLYAGLGYGGSCLPKDVDALLKMGEETGATMEVLRAVDSVNRRQRGGLFKKITTHFGKNLEHLHIALWGLAFKPETDDMRGAPSIDLVQSLLASGAKVVAYDPVAGPVAQKLIGQHPRFSLAEKQYEPLEGADALCLVTEWKSFRRPDFSRMKTLMRSPIIFDGRNQYQPEEMRELGFGYYSFGRPARYL